MHFFGELVTLTKKSQIVIGKENFGAFDQLINCESGFMGEIDPFSVNSYASILFTIFSSRR